jgi:hypothetical protein
VDKGKLLLFIKEEVASRPPRKGRRLKAKRKQKSKSEHATQKKRKGESGAILEEGDDDKACSKLVLMYNTVRGYYLAINELWAHQTSQGYHLAERPQRVAIKALKTLIARSQH